MSSLSGLAFLLGEVMARENAGVLARQVLGRVHEYLSEQAAAEAKRLEPPPARNRRKTHCPVGHRYTAASFRSVRGKPRGRRCGECHRLQERVRRSR